MVHGRVFVDGRVPIGTRILLHGLKRAMKASPAEVASETFQRRVDGFLVAPGKRRRIVLGIDDIRFRLRRRTRRNGAFFGILSLPAERMKYLDNQSDAVLPPLSMRLLRSSDESVTQSSIHGTIHMVSPRGVSVISDIDDTIKLTEATQRREMLANTFLRPFAQVDGMAQLYQSWSEQGCAFHYVSSSPWQLYDPLAELCAECNFPAGSMHLKYFRVRDEMFKRFRPIRRNSKVGIIAGIVKRLPERQFVLVGDSGEKDPEIYRFLAKRFPNQIRAILIRNLEVRPLDKRRLAKLQALPQRMILRVFSNTDEVQDVICKIREAR